MDNMFIEQQVKHAVRGLLDEKTAKALDGIGKIAAKQGGATTIENYKLLGKRALIVLGVAVVAVQATASVVGLVMSRKTEEQRIEKVVRRVLEEERQPQEEA